MLLLHISDIHFRSPDCLHPDTDPDFPIRTRMMRDLAQQVGDLGTVGAILIGGDIAFRAARDEYETAWHWIQQLAQICGSPKERIFVVPGNHDVDRLAIKRAVPTQNAQHAIVSAVLAKRDRKLRLQLADEQSGQALLMPHSEYNRFAAPLGCQIWPAKPFWHQDIDLGGGVNLRVYGLTSTLLSGQDGEDDDLGGLYLGSMQTVLDPAPNTANLVLVHHPLDWLSDSDDVDDALTSRAMFHLFGHKHRQRAVLEANYVRLGAGAVNPSRAEKPYDPGYNLIDLSVAGSGAERAIRVELHQRRLQTNPELFVPIKTRQGTDVFTTSIPLPEEPSIPSSSEASCEGSQREVASAASVEDVEASMGQEDTRELVYRFWRLGSSDRRKIALALGLISNEELTLPEHERYGKALIRASERGQLGAVAREVRKLERV